MQSESRIFICTTVCLQARLITSRSVLDTLIETSSPQSYIIPYEMPSDDITPRPRKVVIKDNKFPFFEDDATFVPPALSSYSISLLNERTKPVPGSQVTGVYELDFPQLKGLKNKLSVHFGDRGSSGFPLNHDALSAPSHTGPGNSFSTHSPRLRRQELSNTHNSITDDHINSMDESEPRHNGLTSHTATTTPGEIFKQPQPRLSKRIRGSRHFGRLLGPPMRAPKVPESSNEENIASTPTPWHSKDNMFETGISVFTELRQHNNDVELWKEKELELRLRIDEQKRLNELDRMSKRTRNEDLEMASSNESSQHKTPPNSSSIRDKENLDKPEVQPRDVARRPLLHISSNVLNIPHEAESFRKPKAVRPGAFSAVPLSDDGKKRKYIAINGIQYEKLELMGRGGTSKVYKVKSMTNQRLYAIKKVTFDQFDDVCVKGFKGEIDLLTKLKGTERVVQLVDHVIGEGSIYLVMECGEIDLAHVFQNRLAATHPLDLNFVKFHSIEMLKCVRSVHDAGIVHSDLKPANFLFIKGVLKIIDFGIANAVPDHTANIYRESQIGTPNYMAPETLIGIGHVTPGLMNAENNMLKNKNTWRVGKPSDVWSCGCIMYQMIYGMPPYGGYSGNQRFMAIMNPQIKISYPSKGLGNVPVPKSAVELLQKCLARDPNERYTVEECLESDFLKPKIVSEAFVRDLVHLAVNFGYNSRNNGTGSITSDLYDRLVDTVLKGIEELNYG